MLSVRHAIAVSSGTDALLLALMALDIKAGDEVVKADTVGSIVLVSPANPNGLTRAARPSDGAPADEGRMLTLAELLRDLDLGLLAGEANADAPVRWVHISELKDPTPWLSGAPLQNA